MQYKLHEDDELWWPRSSPDPANPGTWIADPAVRYQAIPGLPEQHLHLLSVSPVIDGSSIDVALRRKIIDCGLQKHFKS